MKEAAIFSSLVAGGFVAGAAFGASVYHLARVQADKVIATAHHGVDAAHGDVRAAQSLLATLLGRASQEAAGKK